MLPTFLLEDQVIEKAGDGPIVGIENGATKVLALTLGITDGREQQSLDVQIFGSADGVEFGPKALASFPQKFYKGTDTLRLDLGSEPDIRYLRVKWKMNRWGHWPEGPMFRCYVFAEVAAE